LAFSSSFSTVSQNNQQFSKIDNVMFVCISFYHKQLILIFATIGILLSLWHLIRFKNITLLGYLINIFPEEIVSELTVLREQLTKEKKSIWLIRLSLFHQILTLVWAIYIQINLDNLTLSLRDRRIDK
jgi:hypothetical protein